MPESRPATTPSTLARVCPNGCGRLSPLAFGDLAIDRCVTCGGVFLDDSAATRLRRMPKDAFSKLEHAIAPTSHSKAEVAQLRTDPRPCPNCRTLMLPYVVPCRVPVTLDRCPTCRGLWVDDRELEAVSMPVDGAGDVHIDRRVSAEVRNAMTRAIHATSSPRLARRPAGHLALAAIFPTFATWVRKAHAGQEAGS